ncbi:unnamed protein product [Trichogramma brassicae]|uniref:Uncharacterized protein n=1 Tax=Trichogramma brassicae TaxID=86971 RepID=A0A6H5I0D6_9HYME|nr:unnamed protein product [Trichogramma brassicae]
MVGECSISSFPLHPLPGSYTLTLGCRFDQYLRIVTRKGSKSGWSPLPQRSCPKPVGPEVAYESSMLHVIDSILLYGAPIWRCATETQAYSVARGLYIDKPACAHSAEARPRTDRLAEFVASVAREELHGCLLPLLEPGSHGRSLQGSRPHGALLPCG